MHQVFLNHTSPLRSASNPLAHPTSTHSHLTRPGHSFLVIPSPSYKHTPPIFLLVTPHPHLNPIPPHPPHSPLILHFFPENLTAQPANSTIYPWSPHLKSVIDGANFFSYRLISPWTLCWWENPSREAIVFSRQGRGVRGDVLARVTQGISIPPTCTNPVPTVHPSLAIINNPFSKFNPPRNLHS